VTVLRAITLTKALSPASEGLEVSAEALETARELAVRRYDQALFDAGYEHRFVQAVPPLADSPVLADETLAQLESLAGIAAAERVIHSAITANLWPVCVIRACRYSIAT
jgi:hypothetical protein